MTTRLLPALAKAPANTPLLHLVHGETSGQVGRPSALRGLPAMTGFLRGLEADSRAGCARDERGRQSIAPSLATKDSDLQVLYGSDGTRTRDLRRDRLVSRKRRWATMDAESLYSCGFSGFRGFDAAWLSEADFSRLLPVCCPSGPSPRLGSHPRGRRFVIRSRRLWSR